MPNLDFSGIEEFVPVEEGRYLAEVTRSSIGLSARANQRKWSLQLTVVEDPMHDGEFKGKTIKWDISLVKQALWKVKQTLQALGEEISKEDKAFSFDPETYIGRRCTMIVGTQNDPTYGIRTRVNSLLPAAAMTANGG